MENRSIIDAFSCSIIFKIKDVLEEPIISYVLGLLYELRDRNFRSIFNDRRLKRSRNAHDFVIRPRDSAAARNLWKPNRTSLWTFDADNFGKFDWGISGENGTHVRRYCDFHPVKKKIDENQGEGAFLLIRNQIWLVELALSDRPNDLVNYNFSKYRSADFVLLVSSFSYVRNYYVIFNPHPVRVVRIVKSNKCNFPRPTFKNSLNAKMAPFSRKYNVHGHLDGEMNFS